MIHNKFFLQLALDRRSSRNGRLATNRCQQSIEFFVSQTFSLKIVFTISKMLNFLIFVFPVTHWPVFATSCFPVGFVFLSFFQKRDKRNQVKVKGQELDLKRRVFKQDSFRCLNILMMVPVFDN